MENNDGTFEHKAVSHIPKDILNSMKRETGINTDGISSPIEAILKQRMAGSTNAPQQPPKLMSISVDGRVLEVPLDKTEAAVVLLLYIVSDILSKKYSAKRIREVLNQFNFTMVDKNGVVIYPFKVKRRKKSKRKVNG